MEYYEVESLQQLVENYWRLYLDQYPEDEPPSFLVDIINHLEEKHQRLFNTENFRWHDT